MCTCTYAHIHTHTHKERELVIDSLLILHQLLAEGEARRQEELSQEWEEVNIQPHQESECIQPGGGRTQGGECSSKTPWLSDNIHLPRGLEPT